MLIADPLPVVVCGDRNVLWGMAVAVRSALEGASGALNVIVIGTGLEKQDIESLQRSWSHRNLASVSFHDLDRRRIRSFRSTSYLKSKSAYARFYLAEFIPDARRCVYLDTDLVVLRDLYDTETIDMDGKAIAAVRDVSVRVDVTEQARLRRVEELETRLRIRNPENYFNSGFLLIDVPRWRALDAEARLIRVSIERFDVLHSQDQDALNIVFDGEVKLLDPSWNTSQYETDGNFDRGILHLIGTVKPWHHDYKFYYDDLFYQILDRTAYASRRPLPVGSFSARQEALVRALPTMDMIFGKVRRSLQRG